jgi:hypothetical protein
VRVVVRAVVTAAVARVEVVRAEVRAGVTVVAGKGSARVAVKVAARAVAARAVAKEAAGGVEATAVAVKEEVRVEEARAAARAAASRAGAARAAAARVAAAWAEATRAAAAHHLLERGEHAVGALPPREIAASSDSVLNPYTISYPDRFNKEPSHALPVSSNALPAHQAVLGDRIEGLLLVGKTLSWKLSDMNLYFNTRTA